MGIRTMKKVAVVTGASAGIGEATVKRLIEQGYTTYAAARRLDRMANLEKLRAILLPLDLTDDSSIVQAAERIRAEQGRIDVLVNNAGYGSYGAVNDVPLDEARRRFCVQPRRHSSRDHEGYSGLAPQDPLRCRRQRQASGIHGDVLPR